MLGITWTTLKMLGTNFARAIRNTNYLKILKKTLPLKQHKKTVPKGLQNYHCACYEKNPNSLIWEFSHVHSPA